MVTPLHPGMANAAQRALLAGFTATTRLLKLTTPLGEHMLLVECVRGEERLSCAYRFHIATLSLYPDIKLDSLIGQPVLLELLTLSTTQRWRPWHGYITAIAMPGADGGLARYELTIEPWTAFLGYGRDSRVFQRLTVFGILDRVFAGYRGKGRLLPDWRYDIDKRSDYPQRSVTSQYQESDLAFVERLMLEEGLFYYFEHSADPASPQFGQHVLVIADNNGSFKRNSQPDINYWGHGAVMTQDSMDRWRWTLLLQTNAVELSSYDYRTLSQRTVRAASAPGNTDPFRLIARDTPGAYAYPSKEQGQRIASKQLQAIEAGQEIHTGAGTVRTLAPGTTFTLYGQAQLDEEEKQARFDENHGNASYSLDYGQDRRSFLITRVLHLMHNNLSAELREGALARLGPGQLDAANRKDLAGSLHGIARDIVERPVYRNRIDAIRRHVMYRASGDDGHGRLLHPLPTVCGQQTAIVVGPAGQAMHTDRDHRVRLQFHWGRGPASQNRQQHPEPASDSGAQGHDSSGSWTRIATAMGAIAGANWGSNAVPAIGQEVVVDFMDGNIDRPVIIGAVYNGNGQPDAQYNQAVLGPGGATGNAPAWFPGEKGEHAHAAVLSGIKTQALASRQKGDGPYNQLVFDDSPGQPRLSLQHHAQPHEGTAELNLGHLKHQSDNALLQALGFGAELKTEHSLAVRAGKGMLLSSDARPGASGSQLDTTEAEAQVAQSLQLQRTLAETAQKHDPMLKKDQQTEPQQASPKLPELPAIAAMAHSVNVLRGTAIGSVRQKPVTAYMEPHLQLSSPAGFAATTPADAILAAGASASITAGQDINFAAQGSYYFMARAGISLFSYGKASNPDKPNHETGIKLHAASGKVSSQSQGGETRIAARKDVTVASTTNNINVTAKEHVLLTAQGSFLKMSGDNIELTTPSAVEFKASMKELTGPMDGSGNTAALPKAQDIFNEAFVIRNEKTGEPMPHVAYRMVSDSGVTLEGISDELGRTQRLFTPVSEKIKVFLKDQD